ncbi:hypothetical protein HNQ39_001864 [Armatimonas rosea]|uniref:Uncharacterized protein n=1 Tax=Armatimonas rosea TaxID=685828 RepID=A0A7W9W5Y8_ARMRO|nr:hypothetical protein [Armatimonas rosea]
MNLTQASFGNGHFSGGAALARGGAGGPYGGSSG